MMLYYIEPKADTGREHTVSAFEIGETGEPAPYQITVLSDYIHSQSRLHHVARLPALRLLYIVQPDYLHSQSSSLHIACLPTLTVSFTP